MRWVTAQWKQEPISARYDDEFKKGWGPSPFLAQRYDDGVLHVTVLGRALQLHGRLSAIARRHAAGLAGRDAQPLCLDPSGP